MRPLSRSASHEREDPKRGCPCDIPLLLLLLLGVVSIEKPNYTESKGTEYLVTSDTYRQYRVIMINAVERGATLLLAYVRCARGVGELNVQVRIDARIQHYRVM